MYTVSTEAQNVRDLIEQSVNPQVVMSIGIPASGKSQLLEQVAWLHGPNVPVINVDNIRRRFISLRAGRRLAEFIDQEMYKQIEDSLEFKHIALVDATNIESERRVMDIGRYRDLGAITVGGVFLDTPKEVAISRNANRVVPVTVTCIEQMYATIQAKPPTIYEGFDWLMTIKPDEVTPSSRV